MKKKAYWILIFKQLFSGNQAISKASRNQKILLAYFICEIIDTKYSIENYGLNWTSFNTTQQSLFRWYESNWEHQVWFPKYIHPPSGSYITHKRIMYMILDYINNTNSIAKELEKYICFVYEKIFMLKVNIIIFIISSDIC